jgi:topoisomerase IV subunit A
MTTSNDSLVLHAYTEEAYLMYAIATVKDRALAQVQDGLKPVQRRILYAMRQLGLSATGKPVKSARVVGDVLGKYHPHGDSAAYDAMVRMAQPFMLRYPLVKGQGNFGSRDGDSAAAMRYTEAKLSAISELLLDELGPTTVDFQPNYDGTLQEPKLLAARLPVLLLNGTMGIAVGMASDIPPHNLREVAQACKKVLENPGTALEDILTDIVGPDFPEGGQLVSSPEEVASVYRAGRGSLRCRARWVREELARGQWQIVITELPYQISTKRILEQLESLTNPLVPTGKKAITQQQGNLKQLSLEYLERAVDESNKDNPMRLVLSPRNNKVDADLMMAFLLANTSLEDNVSVNMTLVGLDGRPGTKNLLEVLTEWAKFRIVTVRRRTENELAVARSRIHILEGRLTVFLNLEQVIKTIREAEDPKKDLMSLFGLSDAQAEDVLEMRLRQLNRLEGFKLEKELDDLRKEESRLLKILSSEQNIRKVIIKEVDQDLAKFGDDRRTLIQPVEKVVKSLSARGVIDEPVTLVVSKNLWAKCYKGVALPEDTFVFKAGDSLSFKVETSSAKTAVILDTLGRAYSFSCSEVPCGRGDGVPLTTLVELQNSAKPCWAYAGDLTESFLFSGTQGYGFVSEAKSLVSRQKAGKAFMSLSEGEPAITPLPAIPSGYVLCESSAHKVLIFDVKELKVLVSGGRGVQLQSLEEGDTLRTLKLMPELPKAFSVLNAKGNPANCPLTEADVQKLLGKRGRKGAFLPKKQALAKP